MSNNSRNKEPILRPITKKYVLHLLYKERAERKRLKEDDKTMRKINYIIREVESI